MVASRGIPWFWLCLACVGCQTDCERPLAPDEWQAIAGTVGTHFGEIATATNALELDRLLGFYRESDDLTYVAQGRINRSYATFASIFDAQFSGVTAAELVFTETHVDVLARDVAIATARFQFAATFANGAIAGSDGTFTCIYVFRDGRWQIQYSSHTFRGA